MGNIILLHIKFRWANYVIARKVILHVCIINRCRQIEPGFSINKTFVVVPNAEPTPTWGQFYKHVYAQLYVHRSQKCKMAFDLTVIFALLGSTHVKAACKMLMKLTPGVHFTSYLALSTNAPAVFVLHYSVSSTKLMPTLPVNTTRSNTQLLCFKMYKVRA